MTVGCQPHIAFPYGSICSTKSWFYPTKMETSSGSVYFSIPLFRGVDSSAQPCYFLSASRPATNRRFLCIGGGCGSRNHTRLPATGSFQDCSLAFGVNPPYLMSGFSYQTQSHMAPCKDHYDSTIRCRQTLLLIVDSPPIRF